MKALAILTLLTTGALSCTHAQGMVDFRSPTGWYATNAITNARLSAGTAFKVALYYTPYESEVPPSLDHFIALGSPANIGPVAGTFVGGTRTAPTAQPGGLGWFQVRLWETVFGSTYEQALNALPANGRFALCATSNIIQVDTGDPTTIPAGSPASLFGLQSIVVAVLPEPSVTGLLLLGAAAFWLGRRRAQAGGPTPQ